MVKNNIKIKVCGVTRSKDAIHAINLGADFIGFIFYKKSPRFITQKTAKQISEDIPATIFRVGVFVNENKEKILKIAKNLQLDFIQLSGDEKNSEIRYFQNNGFKVIKTFRISSSNEISKLKITQADIVHLDKSDRTMYGGTGEQFKWSGKKTPQIESLMLAGGINKDNVIIGIKHFKPKIIDVNSGVESKPGIKSSSKLIGFFKTVNKYRYGK